MSPEFVIQIGRDTLLYALTIVAPVLALGFIVGITVALFQAVTQIQEMTLAFIPKLIAMCFALVAFGHWMLGKLLNYTTQIFSLIEKVT